MTKLALVISIFVLAVCSAGTGEARTLEDILKEKGVITESDYQEVVKKKPLGYTLGKGFIFTSADERFQLAFGGRMQFRYTYLDKDFSSNTSQFRPQRIKLYTAGYLYGKDLTYGFQADFANGNNVRLLDDAWMNYRFWDEIQIKAGQYKTPFVRQEMISDGNLQFVERSPVADGFKHGRDTGVTLNGRVANGLVLYGYGVFGGVGQSSFRGAGDADSALVARLQVNPLGEMPLTEGELNNIKRPLASIGASYLMNTLKRDATTTFADIGASPATSYFGSNGWLNKGAATFTAPGEKVDVDAFGIDAALLWMGLSMQGEYLQGRGEGTVSGGKLFARGFYVQTGYCIIPAKLEAAFRYSLYDPNRAVHNNTQSEVLGALSYYFDKHNLKLQGDVGSLHSKAGFPGGVGRTSDDLQYRVQAQVTF